MKAAARLRQGEPRAQDDLATTPYDRWVSPDGDVVAEFHRLSTGFLLRFPDRADFAIAEDGAAVTCFPVPETDPAAIATLFANSVAPVIGNHRGGLNLHGSAVVVGDLALAFMGLSRRGKTTLAGAFAKAGFPFLTEDVLALVARDAVYLVAPQPPVLRVFGDSAAYLLGEAQMAHPDREKRELPGGERLPIAAAPVPLGAICVLGPGTAEAVQLTPLGEAAALAEVLQHSFLLDVEDKARLHDHFARVAALVGNVPCYRLDYPRRFDQLTGVVAAIARNFVQGRKNNGTD